MHLTEYKKHQVFGAGVWFNPFDVLRLSFSKQESPPGINIMVMILGPIAIMVSWPSDK